MLMRLTRPAKGEDLNRSGSSDSAPFGCKGHPTPHSSRTILTSKVIWYRGLDFTVALGYVRVE